MTYIKTAGELIKQIDPKNIDSIRMLFSGNLVSLEVFSNVIHTYIPKKFEINESAIEFLAIAIIDLFEELDSDNDGFITYEDFITYYKDSSQTVSSNLEERSRNTQTVFNQIERPSNATSGKTGKITVEPVFQNGGEFHDLPGKSILRFDIFAETYFLTTEDGIFEVDRKFMFSKVIFAPTLANLVERVQIENHSLDEREKERREKEAFMKLSEMGLRVSDRKINELAAEKQRNEENGTFLRGISKETLTADSKITCTCLLKPFPLMAVCCEYPVLILVELNGSLGFSDAVPVTCKVTSMYFEEQSSKLYLGHNNGMISYYELLKTDIAPINVHDLKEERCLAHLKRLAEEKGISNLSKEDLMLIYPELQECIFNIHQHSSDIIHLEEERDEQQKLAHQLLKLRPEDVAVLELNANKVFDATESTLKAHAINATDLIREDPDAFLEVAGQPNALERAIRVRKHGTVHIEADMKFLGSKYAVDGATRFLSGGWGEWESTEETSKLFRIVATGANGSVVVFNEDVEPLAAFADLHPEGVVGLHVFGDNITTIGYHCVYQIHKEAIESAYLGQVLKKIDAYASMTHANKTASSILQLSNSRLMDAELSKARNEINYIEPPRPGLPIIASFALGDLIGVIDHQNTLSIFHQETGAHISRINVKMPNLLRVRFGQAAYHYSKDIGYIVAGKEIFTIRAVPNEAVESDYAVWNVLKEQDEEIEKQLNKQPLNVDSITTIPEIPLASISKNIFGFCVNEAAGEVAIITGDLEISFVSMITGKPERIIDISSLQPEAIEGRIYPSEYSCVETNDVAVQFKQTEFLEASLPQELPKIENDSILNILGDKILNIEVDIKGRILYVVGSIGIITLYWRSAQLFDMSEVGILGKQERSPSIAESVENPFNGQDPPNTKLLTHLRISNRNSVQNNFCYSLKIDFSSLERDPRHCSEIDNIQRYELVGSNRKRNQLFVMDSLSPNHVLTISTSTAETYVSAPTNSRVVSVINSGWETSDRDQLFFERSHLSKEFENNEIINGATEYVTLHKKMKKYFPFGSNGNQLEERKDKEANTLLRLITCLLQPCQLSSHYITTMCISDEEFLLAIGTSDGRIIIVDTSSQEFIRQGTIVLPYVYSPASVTCVEFLGKYPLLFSADGQGICYLHTVRPYDPAFLLVCSWQHASYCPVSFPCHINTRQLYKNASCSIKSILSSELTPNAEYVKNSEIRKEIYQYLYYRFLPDTRFWVVFYGDEFNPEVESRLRGGILRQQAEEGEDSIHYEDTENTSMCEEVLIGKNQFINFKTSSVNEEVIRLPESEIAEVNPQMQEREIEISEYHEITTEIRRIIGQTKYSRSTSTTMASLTSLGKRERKRRAETKIATALVVMMICSGPMRTCMGNYQALAPEYNITFPSRPPTLEERVPSTNHTSFRRKTGNNIEISFKTKRFIDEHEKGVKHEDENETEMLVVRCSTPRTNEELENELKGIIYRTVSINERDVRIPVRKASLETVRLQTVPESALFIDSSRQLLIGDDTGFVVVYDISAIIKHLNLQHITIGTKYVEIAKNAPLEEQITGLVKESLPSEIAVDLQGLEIVPLLHARDFLRIAFLYRAHSGPVERLFSLIDTHECFSVGEDCRLIAWDYTSGVLLGMAQRVSLEPPSKDLIEHFTAPVCALPHYRYMKVEAVSDAQFTREELNPNTINKSCFAPPAFRYEAPPAAEYPWNVRPSDIMRRTEEFRKANVETSIEMENSLDYTKEILKRRKAVPTCETFNEDLYMTTGLTQRQTEEGAASWTVRAILLQSRGQLNTINDDSCDRADPEVE